MGKLRSLVADWWPMSIIVVLLVHAALDWTGNLGRFYRWLLHVSPAGWSALAAWVAVVVGIATVVVAGTYAKQQVDKAQDQVREAQTARLAQERQAQEALATQVDIAKNALIAQAELNQQTLKHDAEQAQKIRQEQAQPNVVLYSDLNPAVKQYIEIVVKNFGTTPAYDVEISIDPVLKSTPNNLSDSKLYEIPIPKFPILAPGQEWRTGWDHSPTRKDHQKKWQNMAGKSETELTDSQKLEIQYLQVNAYNDASVAEIIEAMTLPARHDVKVTYRDRERRTYETEAVLDPEMFKGTTWVDIKTVHNLTKLLEDGFAQQNKLLGAMHDRLKEFGTEHEGVWTYNSSDDEERQYRRAITAAQIRESRESRDHLDWAISGQKGVDPRRKPNPDDAAQALIEEVAIGDWYIPSDNETIQIGQAWRVAFIKRHDYEEVGMVYELFRSNGDSIREREGTLIYIVRADD